MHTVFDSGSTYELEHNSTYLGFGDEEFIQIYLTPLQFEILRNAYGEGMDMEDEYSLKILEALSSIREQIVDVYGEDFPPEHPFAE